MNTAKNLHFSDEQSSCRRQLFEIFDKLNQYSHRIPIEVIRREFSQLPLQLNDLHDFVRFNDAAYQRIELFSSEIFKALLLCWKPGQQSPIHNHTGSDCFVKVIQGTASEIVFQLNDRGLMVPTTLNTMKEGNYCDTNEEYAHILGNYTKADPLVTLHVYTPPLTQMETFSMEQTIFTDYQGLVQRSQAAPTHKGIWQLSGVN